MTYSVAVSIFGVCTSTQRVGAAFSKPMPADIATTSPLRIEGLVDGSQHLEITRAPRRRLGAIDRADFELLLERFDGERHRAGHRDLLHLGDPPERREVSAVDTDAFTHAYSFVGTVD